MAEIVLMKIQFEIGACCIGELEDGLLNVFL
jgi:hypothetical protein